MYFHPTDTSFIYNTINEKQVENLWYRTHYFQQISIDKKIRDYERLKELSEKLVLVPPAKNFLDDLLEEREYFLAQLSNSHELAILRGEPGTRLIHGMGAAHVRETSITLHPLYGIPYIPASSLKGTLRSWVVQAFFKGKEENLKEENIASPEQKQILKIFFDLFGSEECQGGLNFYDAFVERDFSLVPDVLTVHFPKYYQGEQEAGDNQDPNPVNFYTVEAQKLEVVLTVSRGIPYCSGLDSRELLDLAIAWFKTVLVEQGIGAKRSSGYGYFKSIEDVSMDKINACRQRNKQEMSQKKKVAEKERAVREQKKREEEIARAKAAMSPAEQLVYEIEKFSTDEKDKETSKSTDIYQKVLEFAEEGEKAPAEALKIYWKKAGLWKVKKGKKKQLDKVNEIKKILGEE